LLERQGEKKSFNRLRAISPRWRFKRKGECTIPKKKKEGGRDNVYGEITPNNWEREKGIGGTVRMQDPRKGNQFPYGGSLKKLQRMEEAPRQKNVLGCHEHWGKGKLRRQRLSDNAHFSTKTCLLEKKKHGSGRATKRLNKPRCGGRKIRTLRKAAPKSKGAKRLSGKWIERGESEKEELGKKGHDGRKGRRHSTAETRNVRDRRPFAEKKDEKARKRKGGKVGGSRCARWEKEGKTRFPRRGKISNTKQQ